MFANPNCMISLVWGGMTNASWVSLSKKEAIELINYSILYMLSWIIIHLYELIARPELY